MTSTQTKMLRYFLIRLKWKTPFSQGDRYFSDHRNARLRMSAEEASLIDSMSTCELR